MVPSEKALVRALTESVADILRSDERDQLSVTLVRTRVEEELGLPDQFFKEAAWKAKSKQIIQEEHTRLLDREDDEKSFKSTQSKPKQRTVKKESSKVSKTRDNKRASDSNSKPVPRKRQKKEETSESSLTDRSSVASGGSPRELTEDSADIPDDTEISDASIKKKSERARKIAERPALKKQPKPKVQSVGDEKKASRKPSQLKSPKATPKLIPGDALVSDDDEESLDGDTKAVADEPSVDPGADDSGSDMSILIDEGPKPKRLKASKNSTTSKASAKSKASSKVPVELTPDEQELKSLQTQLKKCGINKIWGFELKQFDDDTKAKIKHLRKMLRDIGMEGRFSEVRAKEIKERRELLADVEQIVGNAESLGKPRARRSKEVPKSYKVSGNESEDSGDGSSSEVKARERAARAKDDLAFLGDEESSDDDE
ncbi:MAG: hypothetical protein M1818_003198 [Claussenomyces sp. TS43310]|nr:MAG: hypothetical protein M1818_003198 [Claussenomyces sp. TS43310]